MQLGLSLTALNKPITAFKAGGASEGAVSSLPMPPDGYCPTGYAASGNTCYLVRTASSGGGSGSSGGSNSVKVNTTVSPNITVSPQISPVFQQQFQPTNSPATAGTSQTTAQPSATDIARQQEMAHELEMLNAQLALEQAKAAARREDQTQISVPAPQSSAPAIPPPASYGVTTGGAVSSGGGGGGGLPADFAPPSLDDLIAGGNVLNAESVTTGASAAETGGELAKNNGWLWLAIAGVAVLLLSQSKGKRKRPARRNLKGLKNAS